jgi:hypothetical protein
MKRRFGVAAAGLAVLALTAAIALADPELRVSYVDGVPRIEIAGSYPQARFTVWRRPSIDAFAVPIGSENVLCMGSCYVDDPTAEPGRSYFYDFDLELADGSSVSFGPYAVTISPALAARMRARVVPNPGRGRAAVELFAGGSGEPIEVDARLFDLQGRVVATFHRGPLARGLTSIPWNGRSDDGRALPSGIYLLRLESPLGTAVTRIQRLR